MLLITLHLKVRLQKDLVSTVWSVLKMPAEEGFNNCHSKNLPTTTTTTVVSTATLTDQQRSVLGGYNIGDKNLSEYSKPKYDSI